MQKTVLNSLYYANYSEPKMMIIPSSLIAQFSERKIEFWQLLRELYVGHEDVEHLAVQGKVSGRGKYVIDRGQQINVPTQVLICLDQSR
jgi:hypothetical protein